jgi:hypothetical protein
MVSVADDASKWTTRCKTLSITAEKEASEWKRGRRLVRQIHLNKKGDEGLTVMGLQRYKEGRRREGAVLGHFQMADR